MAEKQKSNEIKIIRVYDAPIEAVWNAWTDPKRVVHWWGPRGFSLTTHSKDVRPGGHWRYTMHGPDGVDYPNRTDYLEVEEHSKLVYDHGGDDERPPLFRVTVLFSEANGKTQMDMSMALPTPQAAEETRKFIKKVGGDSTWDRLAEYLEKESSGKEKFVINRAFEAPVELMYELWTDSKHFSRWLPPVGFEMRFIRSEIRTGGSAFYVMTGSGGAKMYGRVEYLELKRPSQIIYTQQFCDENEKISRHPMVATWPETMLTVVRLAEEGPGKTRITVCWEPYGKVSHDELETFVKAKSGMAQGWTGSFDKLEAYLLAT